MALALLAPAASGCCSSSLVPILDHWSPTASCRAAPTAASSRVHPGALPAVLRSALPDILVAAPSFAALLCTVLVPAAGLSGGYAIARGGHVEEPAAVPGRAALLDQRPGPDLRDDLPAPRHRAHQHAVALARAHRRTAHPALHPERRDGGAGLQFLPFMVLPIYASLEKLDRPCWKPRRCWAPGRPRGSCG